MRLATVLLVGVALTASAVVAVAQRSSTPPSAPGFEYLGSLQVQTGTRTVVENGPQGTRTIVQINGGRFEGPRLKASVQTPAGDWITNRADGSYRLDVRMTLRTDDGALILANDDWQSDPTQVAQLTNLGLALQDPKESGLVATVQPGSYTAILSGTNQTTGVGLVEIYDTNQAANSQLANISTRGLVLTGANVMIGGFILGGNSNTHVVVRGIGPSLAQAGTFTGHGAVMQFHQALQ